MTVISFFVMYFVMFLGMARLGHYHTSLTRVYMAILMVAPMMILMLLLMRDMYKNKNLNIVIIFGSTVLFVATLVALRSQTPVRDVQYMKAMIPHHSSAILTSRQASLRDSAVKELARKIIESQEKEIAEMEAHIRRLER